MSEKIHAQNEEIVEALGKRLLDEIKGGYTAESLKTLAEAYEIARRASYDY